MKRFNHILAVGVVLVGLAFSVDAQVYSVYTNLADKTCRTVKTDDETGSSTQQCRGFGKWSLMTLYDDQRMSVNVVAPDRKAYELNYWSVITTAFSSLGDKAEWRVRKEKNGVATPIALIVRVNAAPGGNGGGRTSYLAIAKITDGDICVTDKIGVQRNANLLARQAADEAANKPCLQ